MSFGWGVLDTYEPYLSPGIQLGFNSDKGFFYGFQISMGVSYSPEEYIYSSSICFGYCSPMSIPFSAITVTALGATFL